MKVEINVIVLYGNGMRLSHALPVHTANYNMPTEHSGKLPDMIPYIRKEYVIKLVSRQ